MLNKIKLTVYGISALLITGGALSIRVAYDKYMTVSNERDNYRNNQRFYEDKIANKDNENRVLRLSAADLRDSNDKMVHRIDSIQKSLKIKQNKPGGVSAGFDTGIHHTDTTYISNPSDFKLDTIVKHNDLTLEHIKIKKDSLISSLDINNSMYLYVYSSREFVNKRANWFDRLIHLDYKKEDYLTSTVKMSNDLIRVEDSRVYMNDKEIK